MNKLSSPLVIIPVTTTCFIFGAQDVYAQSGTAEDLDLSFIEKMEHDEPAKVLHAEPLFVDLIRDLGARKGEKEWNAGFALTDQLDYDVYEGLVEYEFARRTVLAWNSKYSLFFFRPIRPMLSHPANQIEALEFAVQWSFLVSVPAKTSLALGYKNSLEIRNPDDTASSFFSGNAYSPFIIAAKRWGRSFHSLIYTGPIWEQHFQPSDWHTLYQINTSFHYMIPGTENFIGIEFNKLFESGDFDMVIRPQMRLEISEHIMLGLVVGIPIDKENERLSTFIRLIYEPGEPVH